MKKRIALITLLLLMLLASVAFAAKPVIKADTTYFDPGSGVYVLKGNVYIEIGKRIITAPQAKVSLGSMEVWGSGGVTVREDDIFFAGESVYVYGKSQTAKIDGGLHFSRTNLDITANSAEYNWKTGLVVFSGDVDITQDGVTRNLSSISYNVRTNTVY